MAWEGIAACLKADTPPPLCERGSRQRNEPAWVEAATSRLEATREALVGLAKHPKQVGAGVSVTRFWKAGSVDYKKVVKLKGVDLESHRGKAREDVRVTAVQ